jgi:hypothetical protein
MGFVAEEFTREPALNEGAAAQLKSRRRRPTKR